MKLILLAPAIALSLAACTLNKPPVDNRPPIDNKSEEVCSEKLCVSRPIFRCTASTKKMSVIFSVYTPAGKAWYSVKGVSKDSPLYEQQFPVDTFPQDVFAEAAGGNNSVVIEVHEGESIVRRIELDSNKLCS